jgi:hypothetical protein
MGLYDCGRVKPLAIQTLCRSYYGVALKDLHGFNSQNLSNIILWSFATARESNPLLFKRTRRRPYPLIERLDLNGFNSQDGLSNIAWAYATAGGRVTSAPLSKVERVFNPKVWMGSSAINKSPIYCGRMPSSDRRTDGPQTFVPVVRTSCEIKDERLRQPKSSKHGLGVCGSLSTSLFLRYSTQIL